MHVSVCGCECEVGRVGGWVRLRRDERTTVLCLHELMPTDRGVHVIQLECVSNGRDNLSDYRVIQPAQSCTFRSFYPTLDLH